MVSGVSDLPRRSLLIAKVMVSGVSNLLRRSLLIAEVVVSDVSNLLRRSLLIAEVVISGVSNLLRCSLLIGKVVKNNVVVLSGSLRLVVEVVLESGTADPLGCSSLNTRSATGEEHRAKGEAWNKMERKEFALHLGMLGEKVERLQDLVVLFIH